MSIRLLGSPWRTNFLILCSLVVLLGYKTPFPRHQSITRLIDRDLHSLTSLREKNQRCRTCTSLFSSSQVDVAVPLKEEVDTEACSHNKLHLPICTVHTLLIDNFDSYTYNIWQLLAEVNGMNPTVVYNNAFDGDWDALMAAYPDIDNIVLSPGPGSPDVAHDFGLCLDAIKRADVPVLGVCLGHQGIAHAFGGQVIRAPTPMHGRLSAISHDGDGLFSGIPQQTDVVRYHSLIASDPLPNHLRATAWTTDGIIMGLQHLTKPLYGVQFHPESVATACGRQLFSNFKSITLQHPTHKEQQQQRDKERLVPPHRSPLAEKGLPYQQQPSQQQQQQRNVFPKPIPSTPIHRSSEDVSQNTTLQQSSVISPNSQPLSKHDDKITTTSPSSSTILRERHVFIHRKRFSHAVDVHAVFKQLHGISPASFWLDSSNAPTSLPTEEIRHGRSPTALSFFGEVTTKGVSENKKSSVVMQQSKTSQDTDPNGLTEGASFVVEYYGSNKLIVRTGQETIQLEQNIFNYLDDRLKQSKMHERELIHFAHEDSDSVVDNLRIPLPFNVTSALFGYLGYEARHEAASILTHPPHRDDHSDEQMYNMSATLDNDYVASRWEKNLSYPMALFLSPNEYAVYDHENRDMYVVSTSCVSVDDVQEIDRAMQRAKHAGRVYLNRIIDAVATDINHSLSETSIPSSLSSSTSPSPIMSQTINTNTNTNTNTTLHALRCRQQYRDDIHKCLDYIQAGESYEICLTLQFQGILEAKKDESLASQHLDVYTTLRARNPAPYSCYLHYDPVQLMEGRIDNSNAQPVVFPTLPLPLSTTPQIIGDSHSDHIDERINNGNDELLAWYRPGGFSVCSSSPERYLKATKVCASTSTFPMSRILPLRPCSNVSNRT